MLTCSQCQFENPPDHQFCQRCGAPLSAPSGASETSTQPSSAEVLGAGKPPGAEPLDAELLGAELLGAELLGAELLGAGLEPSKHGQMDGQQGAQLQGRAPKASAWKDPGLEDPELQDPGLQQDPELQDPGLQQDPGLEDPELQDPELEKLESEETAFGVSADDEDLPTMLLPMQLARLDSAGLTHVGRQRDHNEDYFDTQTECKISENPGGKSVHARGLYILCDGMGGHSAGEVASAMAVEQLKAYFKLHWKDSLPDKDCIRDAIFTANRAIFEVNEQNDSAGSGRMGTTLVLMLLQDTQVAIAHVGDSRLYTYSRKQGLEQQTLDHEVGQLEVMRGVDSEIAYARPEAYQLTQALGPKSNDFIDPEVQFLELNEDIIFLLCSDGLSDYGLLEEHAEGQVKPLLSSRSSLEQGVGELVHLANELSGHDNITAIAIRAKVRPDARTFRS